MVKKRLFLGGLYHEVDPPSLSRRFKSFGDISNVEIKTKRDSDGVPIKTFAYVDIECTDEAFKKCLSTYNGAKWNGFVLCLQEARPSFLQKLQAERQEAGVNFPAKIGQPKLPKEPKPLRIKEKDKSINMDLKTVNKKSNRINLENDVAKDISSLTWTLPHNASNKQPEKEMVDSYSENSSQKAVPEPLTEKFSKKRKVEPVEKNGRTKFTFPERTGGKLWKLNWEKTSNDLFEGLSFSGDGRVQEMVVDAGVGVGWENLWNAGVPLDSSAPEDSFEIVQGNENDKDDDDRLSDCSADTDEIISRSKKRKIGIGSDIIVDTSLASRSFDKAADSNKDPREQNGNTNMNDNEDEENDDSDEDDDNEDDDGDEDDGDDDDDDSENENEERAEKNAIPNAVPNKLAAGSFSDLSNDSSSESETDSKSKKRKKKRPSLPKFKGINSLAPLENEDFDREETSSGLLSIALSLSGQNETVKGKDVTQKRDKDKKDKNDKGKNLTALEKRKMADQRRLESVKEQQEERKRRSEAVKGALLGIDRSTTPALNKKIVFDSDDNSEDETAVLTSQKEKVLKKGTEYNRNVEPSDEIAKRKTKSGMSLFDDDDDDVEDSVADAFEPKPHFEGEAGRRLMELQAKYKSDERFKLNTRFLEAVDDNEGDNEPERDTDLKEEKQKALEILNRVLGKSIEPARSEEDAKKKKKLAQTTVERNALRYDPETGGDLEVKKTLAEKPKKSKKEATRVKDEDFDKPPPVLGDRFYEVDSSSLKMLFLKDVEEKGVAPPHSNPTFSFGFAVETDEATLKSPVETMEIDDSGDDDHVDKKDHAHLLADDDHEDDDFEEAVLVEEKLGIPAETSRETFFLLSLSDPRLEEGRAFFRGPDETDETIREAWKRDRTALVEMYKTKHRQAGRRKRKTKKWVDHTMRKYYANCEEIFDSESARRRLNGKWNVCRENPNSCYFAQAEIVDGKPRISLSVKVNFDGAAWTVSHRCGDDDQEFFHESLLQFDEDTLFSFLDGVNDSDSREKSSDSNRSSSTDATTLTNAEILRFGRQLVLPELGVSGQKALKSTRILVVGAGGLGCPAAVYLAAAGVGVLGIVDYDAVEVSNLHRQIAHGEDRLGVGKAESLARTCLNLNPSCQVVTHATQIESTNAMEILSGYDVALDCSDNVATRYLINDACVLSQKPLVSGSALRWEGQLTVYNSHGGPCYRCLFPRPPPPETVTNCSDGGVIGVVPGVVGSLQALEAIKIAIGRQPSFSQKLLLYDGLNGSFRSIKLRSRKSDCCICGSLPSVKKLIDYEQFCGAPANDKNFSVSLLSPEESVSVEDYAGVLARGDPHFLLDVRPIVETEICRLPISSSSTYVNLPVDNIVRGGDGEGVDRIVAAMGRTDVATVFVVCKRGNDSQIAVSVLKNFRDERLRGIAFKNLSGGLYAWKRRVDQNFPIY